MAVDDDPEVLRAVERDLRRQYADRYRVLRADSGATAFETLKSLKERGDAVERNPRRCAERARRRRLFEAGRCVASPALL